MACIHVLSGVLSPECYAVAGAVVAVDLQKSQQHE